MRWEGWGREGGDRWNQCVRGREIECTEGETARERDRESEERGNRLNEREGQIVVISSVCFCFCFFTYLLASYTCIGPDRQTLSLCLRFSHWFLGCWRTDGNGDTTQSPSTALHLDTRATLTQVLIHLSIMSVCLSLFFFNLLVFCQKNELWKHLLNNFLKAKLTFDKLKHSKYVKIILKIKYFFSISHCCL